jgi:hypothetical protein
MADIELDLEAEKVVAEEVAVPMTASLPTTTSRRALPIIPRTLDQTMAIATTLYRSGLAPPSLQTVDRIAFAILAGAEVGLAPIAALRSVMVVNGVATLYGDGLLGVIRASGHLASIREKLERDPRGIPYKAICTVRRRGDQYDHSVTFTRDDAVIAGLWGKKGPWTTNPGRMLTSRARNFCLRDVFSDILIGLTGPLDVPIEQLEAVGDAFVEGEETPTTTTAAVEPEPRRGDPGD